MKIIYIGNAIDKKATSYKKGISIAGNKMQVGIIKGLQEYLKDKLEVLTVYPIASYPKEKDIFIKRSILKVTEKINAISIPFINILGLKQLTQVIGIYKELKSLTKKYDKNIKLICFNAFPYTALSTIFISKRYKLESICILADLPIEVVQRNFIGKILRYIDTILCKWCITKFDKIVALNKEAINIYAKNKEHIVVDGGIDIEDIDDICYEVKGKKTSSVITMLYSGTLIEYNGIINLLEGVKKSKYHNFKVEIYGEGPLREYVERESLLDDRIVYKGNISNKEMMKRQSEVDILINPRPVNDLVSRVTFPSKIIEYMVSGTPIITTRLNGLTAEYEPYINYFNGDSIFDITEGLERIIETDYKVLKQKSINGKEFIISNKNWENQCKKIYNFIQV